MVITTGNPETTDLEKSYLANPYSEGTTSIEVKNNDRFAANDRIMIGEMGQEKTEIVTVSSVNANGTTIGVGATVFSHSADDPVYQMPFDQVKIYRSIDGGLTYSVLNTVPLDVDNADLETNYNDVSGLATYYYKTKLYHSLSALESEYSAIIAGGGFRREQVGRIIDEILREVSDPGEQNITRSELIGYFNDVNDDLTTSVARPFDFLHARTALTRTANTNYIDFPVDDNGKQLMWKFDRMDYNFTDSTTTPTTDSTTTINQLSAEEFRNRYADNTIDTTTVSDNVPQDMTLDTSVNRFRFSAPFSTTLPNVFYLHYWKYFNTITQEDDIIETPTPKIYKLYAKNMYYRKRAITDSDYIATADRFAADYSIEKANYRLTNRKDQGTPRSIIPQSRTSRSFRR